MRSIVVRVALSAMFAGRIAVPATHERAQHFPGIQPPVSITSSRMRPARRWCPTPTPTSRFAPSATASAAHLPGQVTKRRDELRKYVAVVPLRHHRCNRGTDTWLVAGAGQTRLLYSTSSTSTATPSFCLRRADDDAVDRRDVGKIAADARGRCRSFSTRRSLVGSNPIQPSSAPHHTDTQAWVASAPLQARLARRRNGAQIAADIGRGQAQPAQPCDHHMGKVLADAVTLLEALPSSGVEITVAFGS